MRLSLLLVPLAFSTALIVSTAASGEGADAAAGKKLFKRCSVCHRADADESKRGPSLQGVVGRKAASYPGYPYSDAMRKAASEGLVWNEDELKSFLKKPQAMVKGTWMAFAGLTKEKDLENMIAYLKQHSE
ncbi:MULTISPECIES: c-type cytochrome [Brucella/Ochrobactrum group]|jgi:cytochrome c|uniref:Cytochrome c family protein n=1 Tax=Brucella pseudintermedia TaxID=370111 RepID=A0ABY5UJJ9_9HYPH|nr:MULTISPECIES: cytochrome c family protein [Brucella/Ochrobactrum group]KAB2683504.1 cytochrome c family protein [Brucella pseudintermedia]MCO7726112.1 cytochrome c family protein [Brucella intermedia]NKE73974.1 cytochrome c family protein [Ochrobactrum sp. MC-1LL]TWG96548.1 cytochrome c [Ochrobactrum sp. J50]UWL62842.1 cytochrome c family protein [Brucella pseudintermedia]